MLFLFVKFLFSSSTEECKKIYSLSQAKKSLVPIIFSEEYKVKFNETCRSPFQSIVDKGGSHILTQNNLTSQKPRNVKQLFKYMAIIKAGNHFNASSDNEIENLLKMINEVSEDSFSIYSYFIRITNMKQFPLISKIFMENVQNNTVLKKFYDEFSALLRDNPIREFLFTINPFQKSRIRNLGNELNKILSLIDQHLAKVIPDGPSKYFQVKTAPFYFLKHLIQVIIDYDDLMLNPLNHVIPLQTSIFLLYASPYFLENDKTEKDIFLLFPKLEVEIRVDHFRYQCFDNFEIEDSALYSAVAPEKKSYDNNFDEEKREWWITSKAKMVGKYVSGKAKEAGKAFFDNVDPKFITTKELRKSAMDYVKNRVDDYIEDADPSEIYYYNLFINRTNEVLRSKLMETPVPSHPDEIRYLEKMAQLLEEQIGKPVATKFPDEIRYPEMAQLLEEKIGKSVVTKFPIPTHQQCTKSYDDIKSTILDTIQKRIRIINILYNSKEFVDSISDAGSINLHRILNVKSPKGIEDILWAVAFYGCLVSLISLGVFIYCTMK